MRVRTGLTTTAAVLAVGLLTACGGGGDDAGSTADESPTTDATTEGGEPTSEAPTTGAEGEAGGETIETTTTDLGTFLIDGEGMTLYLFTKDSPGKSVCEADCLAAWPPVVGEAQAGEGVDASMLGTITRSDGATQASYNDWPLYYYTPDQAPGDVTGQGVNDVWWVISPEGEAIMGAASPTSMSLY